MKTVNIRLIAPCCALLVLAACGKKAQPEATASTPGWVPPTATNSTVATTSGQTPAVVPAQPDLEEITRDLRKWIVRNQRPPKSFEDFAATANTQIPPAPAGKKFAIDKQMHVILVNR